MQFLTCMGAVECPACGTYLRLLSEYDHRVAQMKHDGLATCSLYDKIFRVDRRSGYAEVLNVA